MAALQAKGIPGEIKIKSEKAKKAEAVKEISLLKIKINNMEREKNTHLYNKHGDFHKTFYDLEEMDHKLDADCKAQKARMVQQFAKIKNTVKKFHRELQNVKPTAEFLDKIKISMEDIERQISVFKEQQKEEYEQLVRDERLINQEVMVLEKRLEAWSQQEAAGTVSSKSKTPMPVASHRDITKDLPPEVAAFERFVQHHGGPRGGWDEYDHGTFLKYRNRHKGKKSFLQEVIGYIPTKTEEEIHHHELWYQEYLSLYDKKKEAIAKWKERKETEKEAQLEEAVAEENEEEKEMGKELARQRLFEQERLERRMQLNAWKVEKELQRAEQEEFKMRQKMEKMRKEESDRKKQMEMRAKVEEYRIQKEAEERERQLEKALQEEQEAERKQAANFMIAKFQHRDMEKIMEKNAQERERKRLEMEKKMKLEQQKAKVNVERDPSRLYKMTDAWKERQKDKTSSGGLLLHMPHRAVPSWRQGLT